MNLVKVLKAHGGLGSPVTQRWGSQEAKALGHAVYCILEGLSGRLFGYCP